MEVLLFLLLSVVVGLLHGLVLRYTLPEEARSRSIMAGLLAGPLLVAIGALPFLMPALVGLIIGVIGFYALMWFMHDQPWLPASLVLVGDLVICGAAAFTVLDIYMIVTGMESVAKGI